MGGVPLNKIQNLDAYMNNWRGDGYQNYTFTTHTYLKMY